MTGVVKWNFSCFSLIYAKENLNCTVTMSQYAISMSLPTAVATIVSFNNRSENLLWLLRGHAIVGTRGREVH